MDSASESLTWVVLVPEAQALREWCAVADIAVFASKLYDVCAYGSSSSHRTDESKLDTFRDAREGPQRAPVFLP